MEKFWKIIGFFWCINCYHTNGEGGGGGIKNRVNVSRESEPGDEKEPRVKMKKVRKKRGFTMIEIMFVVSIIGVLAAIGIPAILGAYSNAQVKVRERNVAEVEKAKGVLTLPIQLGMVGAMGLSADDEFDAAAISNLCMVMHISDISELTVGNVPIVIGTLTEKANYDALTELANYE